MTDSFVFTDRETDESGAAAGGRGNDILLAGDGNDTTNVARDGDAKTLTVTGSTLTGNMPPLAEAASGEDGAPNLPSGGSGSDLLYAGSDDARASGFDNDLLRGRDGNDVLIGNQGNDFGEPGGDGLINVYFNANDPLDPPLDMDGGGASFWDLG